MFLYFTVLLFTGALGAPPIPDELAEVFSRHPNIHNRIVGGEEAEPNSKPWMVSVQTRGGFHFCGGSVLNDYIILTAAHCIDKDDPSQVFISAGDHDVYYTEGTEQRVGLKDIWPHEQWDDWTYENDIALLFLDKVLVFNDYVTNITLPYQMQEFSGKAEVTGWGDLQSGGPAPDVLHQVTVPLVSDSDCRDAYGEYGITDEMLCAGEGGKDSCQGDSGGPLTCYLSGYPGSGTPYQCGVVSWGQGCADERYPGVYTEVAYYVDWIDVKVKEYQNK